MTNKPMLSVDTGLLKDIVFGLRITQERAIKELRAILDKDANNEAIQCGGSCRPSRPKEVEWATIEPCQPHGSIAGVGFAFPHKSNRPSMVGGDNE